MQKQTLRLPWPDLRPPSSRIYPVFIPFAGCPRRCIFCAQHLQSGQEPCAEKDPTLAILKEAHLDLENRQAQGLPAMELAFYGGTFTALPEKDFTAALTLCNKLVSQEIITGARCSTRPDAIAPEKLHALKEAGFHTIELGVQSFDSTALHLAQRHYTEEIALGACKMVRAAGFNLGVQLMPGMPGVDEAIFLADVQKALAQQTDFLRFYPCQVIAGTELEKLWHAQKYTCWTLEQSITALSEAWLKAHLAKVPVIRMGLAPQPELDAHIMAGPRHEALGNMVQAEALFNYVSRKISQSPLAHGKKDTIFPIEMTLPKSCQGYFWGHKQNLVHKWEELGLLKKGIHWHAEQYIEILL